MPHARCTHRKSTASRCELQRRARASDRDARVRSAPIAHHGRSRSKGTPGVLTRAREAQIALPSIRPPPRSRSPFARCVRWRTLSNARTVGGARGASADSVALADRTSSSAAPARRARAASRAPGIGTVPRAPTLLGAAVVARSGDPNTWRPEPPARGRATDTAVRRLCSARRLMATTGRSLGHQSRRTARLPMRCAAIWRTSCPATAPRTLPRLSVRGHPAMRR